MKLKLLSLLLFAATSFAQNIVFADLNFKNKLLSANSNNGVAYDLSNNSIDIDINNDNEIQISEALSVYKLNVNASNITNLEGIQFFTNLKDLSAAHNVISNVDVSTLINLTELTLSYNEISSINVLPLAELKYLYLDDNMLTEINVSGLNNIEHLWVRRNALTSLNISGPSYTNVAFAINQISSFDVSGLPNLQVISCGGNQSLTSLDFNAMPNLISFMCEECYIPNIDLSNSPGIIVVMITESQAVETINLKNGNVAEIMDEWQFSVLPNLEYICVDEGEKWFFDLIFANLPQDQKPNVNTYCTPGIGGNYNTISGTVRFDANNDGCTPVDSPLKYLKLLVNNGISESIVYTGQEGHYNIPVTEGTYTITPIIDSDFIVTPGIVTVNVTEVDNSTITHNFCGTANATNANDVAVLIEPIDGARPGFDAYYKVVVKNMGNQPLSGTVTLTFPDDVVDYISSSITPTINNNNNTITYTYSNLQPFELQHQAFGFNVNSPMETPAVNIDDILTYTVTVTADADVDLSNNTFSLQQTVVGSFDPNDMACLDGEIVHPDRIGQYLHYNINFENTGNFPATFIVVKNEIDAEQFDINTLEVLNASHEMTTTVTGNKVEFRFDDINLQALGKGNIVFRTKTLPTVAVNSTVTQNAEIFFDYNWPIVTNDANTTFTILSRGNFAADNTVAVYPNPANGIVTVKANTEIKSIELYDVQGRLLQVTKSNTIDVAQRAAGMYFVKVLTEQGAKVERFIRQ